MVFISYSHDSQDHMERVLDLSDRLRDTGIDSNIDQYETSPPEGWPRWMANQIEEADFVLVVCTKNYERRFKGKEDHGKGLGVNWEGAIITQELYDAEAMNTTFIPVIFSPDDSAYIPLVLRSATSYNIATKEGYDTLYSRLTNQPYIVKPELGKILPMPPRERKQEFLGTRGSAQIIQEKIERLSFEAEEIIELSKKFFSSISIQTKNQMISAGSSIPALDGRTITNPRYVPSYSWGKLSTEMSEMQVELLRKYHLWYEKSRFLISEFLSDRLESFDSSYKKGRKYISLDCSPDNTKSFHEFKQHFDIEQNILSLISSLVEDDEKTKNKKN